MIRHIILWKMKDAMTEAEKRAAAQTAKKELESLSGSIPGLLKIKVHINGLASSNADMMLESEFTDAAALETYQTHPMHVRAASNYIRPVTDIRMCMDFETED